LGERGEVKGQKKRKKSNVDRKGRFTVGPTTENRRFHRGGGLSMCDGEKMGGGKELSYKRVLTKKD